MSKVVKQFLTLTLSAMMVFTSIAPVFAESPANENQQSQTIENVNADATTSQSLNNNLIEDTQATNDESTVKENAVEEPLADLKIKSDIEYHIYPVILGYNYKDEQFSLVEWAPYIDPKEDNIEDFYKEYLKLSDNKIKDEEKEKIEKELLDFVSERLEKINKDKDAENPEITDEKDLPLGIYYICGEGLVSMFVELNEEGEVKITLEKAESEEEVKEEPTNKKSDIDEKGNTEEKTEEKAKEEAEKPSDNKSQDASPLKKGPSTRSGNNVIQNLNATLIGGAETQSIDGQDVLVYTPNSSYSGYYGISGNPHSFIYKVNFNLKDDEAFAPGTVSFTIPAHLFPDRTPDSTSTYGQDPYLDNCTLPVPEAPQHSANGFSYTYDEETGLYTITNAVELSATFSGVFEFSYDMVTDRQNCWGDIVDGIIQDDNGVNIINPNAGTLPLDVNLTVGDDTSSVSVSPVLINTATRNPTVGRQNIYSYDSWPSNWGAAPADADEYVYSVYQGYINTQYSLQPSDITISMTNLQGDAEIVACHWDPGDLARDGSIQQGDSLTTRILESYRPYYGYYQYYSYLLRYPKDSMQDGVDISIKGTVTATLTGIDDHIERTTNSTPEVFHFKNSAIPFNPPSEGDISLSNSESVSNNGYGGLELLDDDRYTLKPYSYNSTWVQALPLTLAEGGDRDNLEDYGKETYNVEFKRDTFYLQKNDEYYQLNPNEYELQTLYAYSLYFYDFQPNSNGTGYSYSQSSDYSSYPETDIYVQFGTNPEWVRLGYFYRNTTSNNNLYFRWDNAYREYGTSNGVTMSSTIALPEGVSAFKAVCDTSKAGVYMNFRSYTELRSSDAIKDFIEGETSVSFGSVNTWVIKDKQGAVINDSPTGSTYPYIQLAEVNDMDEYGTYVSHAAGTTPLRRTLYRTISSSSQTTPTNNVLAARAELEQSFYSYECLKDYPSGNVTLEDLYRDNAYRDQPSGTFYILLPLGASIEPASLNVYGTRRTSKSDVSTSEADSNEAITNVEYINNYRNSGRTMVKVHCEAVSGRPNGGFYLSYKLYYPWNSVSDYGRNLKTLWAYQTDNDEYGSPTNSTSNTTDWGHPDDANYSGFSADDKVLMTDLDGDENPEGTKPQFAYGSISTAISVVTAASLNIDKTVKSNRSSLYTHGIDTPEYVYSGEKYSYQMHFGADEGSTITNAVIFDKLESYLPEGETESWRGKLDNVDVSQPVSKGADAKVWYSTKEDIDISTETDLSNSSVWSLTKPENPVAIAVDLREKPDGTEFKIEENETINVIVNMTAPYNNADALETGEVKAYNDLYFQNDLKTGTGTTASNLQHQKYTAIGIKCQKTNIDGSKIWLDETDAERTNSVTINLLKNGSVIDSQEVSASTKWAYSFKNLNVYDNDGNEYEYTVEEDNAPEGYGVKVKTNNDKALLVHFNSSMATADAQSRMQIDLGSSRTSSLPLTNFAGKTVYIPASSFIIRSSLYGNNKVSVDNITVIKKGSATGDYSPSFGNNTRIVSGNAATLFQGNELPETQGTLPMSLTTTVIKYEATGTTSYNVFNYYLTTNRTIKKHWTDESESTRPESVTLKLLRNGEEFMSHTVTASDDWQYTFEDVPMYDDNLNLYEYSASEEPVENYRSATANGTDITFDHKFATADSDSYVRIYYKKDGKTYYLREQGSDSGKWYGSGRYGLAGKTIHVPSDDVYIYFYNYSNSDRLYGMKVTDISPAKINTDDIRSTESSLQTATATELENGALPETAHPYNNTHLWHYKDEPNTTHVVNSYYVRPIDGVVSWFNDNEANRPETVTVKLYKNGEEVDSITTDAAHNWEYSFGNVPRYDNNGNDYEYTVVSETDGYTAFYSREDDVARVPTKDFFNVDMVFNSREIKITKNFVNVDDPSYYPESITAHLVRKPENPGIIEIILSEIFGISRDKNENADYRYVQQNEYVTEADKWVKEGNVWTYTFAIPDNGDDWEVWEEPIEKFRLLNGSDNPAEVRNNEAILTNICNFPITISGKKVWADTAERNIPENITLDIVNDDGENVATVTTDAEHNWEYSVELPKYKEDPSVRYKYKVSEREIENFKAEYHGSLSTAVTFGQRFETESGYDYVQIYYRLPNSEQIYRLIGQGSDSNGKWTGSSTGSNSLAGKTIIVPSGDFYIYWHSDTSNVAYGFDTISAEPVANTTSQLGVTATLPSYSAIEVDDISSIKTAHNYSNNENYLWHISRLSDSNEPTYGLYDITNTSTVRDVTGTVAWFNDNEANRPDSVTIKLLRNGSEIDSKEISADDDWSYAFLDVPKWDNSGNLYSYSVEESTVDKYGTVYTNGTESSGAPVEGYYDIENTFQTRIITVTKTWTNTDEENPENRPESVTIHLKRTPEKQNIIQIILGQIFGTKTDEETDYHYDDSNDYVSDPTKWIKNGDTWTYKFAIPANDDNWEVWEEPVPHYTASNGEDNPATVTDNTASISNECIPQTRVSGTKIWIGDTPEDRPEKITLELLQDGDTVVDTIEVPSTESVWTFPPHEKYKANGTEHEYKVREVAAEGYSTSYYDTAPFIDRDSVGTKITFGTFDTYNSSDYLQIYYVRDGQTYQYRTGSYSGSYYGGSSSTYSLHNKTITIPSNEVYFRWYTNGSNTGYGFKINSIETVDVEIPASETTATLPSLTPINCSGTQYPETNHNYSNYENKMWKYTTTPQAIRETVNANSSDDPTVGYNCIVNTANWRTFEGQKTWQDSGESDRPASITVNLLCDGEVVDSTTTNAEHDWAYSFDTAKKYPDYDSNGNKHVYSVSEEPVQGYITKYSDIGEVDSVGTKITFGTFNTYHYYDCLRIYYVRDGQTYQYRTGSSGGDYYGSGTYSLNNKTITLPSNEIYFRWYTNSYSTAYGFKINKIEAIDAEIPENETTSSLPVMAVTEMSGSQYPETSHNYSNNENKMWKYTTTPTKVEKPTLVENVVDENFNITNVRNFRTFEGQKTWSNDTPEDRPESITIDLLQDGEVVDTTTTSAAEDWAYSFDTPRKYLDKKADGTSYEYSVRERPIENYITRYSPNTQGTAITFGDHVKASSTYYYGLAIYYKKNGNYYKLAGQGVNNSGYWTDSSSGNALAGKTLLVPSDEVFLYWYDSPNSYNTYYGFEIANIGPAEVDENTITSSPVYNFSESDYRTMLHEGARISQNATGYARKYWHYKAVTAADPAVDGFNIENHRNLIDITGTKRWTGDDESQRPDTVTLELYQNGSKQSEQTVSADDNWEFNFEDVPEYDENGARYNYEVKEVGADGYMQITSEKSKYGVNVTFGEMDIPSENLYIYYRRDGMSYLLNNHALGGKPGDEYNYANKTVYIPSDDFSIYQTRYNAGKWDIQKVEAAPLVIPESEAGGYYRGGELWPVPISFSVDVPYPKSTIRSMGEDSSEFSEWDYKDSSNSLYYYSLGENDVINDYNVRNIEGNIKFMGGEDYPESIRVDLFRNGEKVDSRTTQASEDYEFRFTNLPKRDESGRPYSYSVEQEAIDDYVPKYGTTEYDWTAESFLPDGSDPDEPAPTSEEIAEWLENQWNEYYGTPTSGAFYIVNRYNKQNLTGQKFWEGDTPEDRPNSIKVRLYNSSEVMTKEEWHSYTQLESEPVWLTVIHAIRNFFHSGSSTSAKALGIKFIEEKTVTADDNWQYTFEDVPVVDSNGNALYYRVEEVPFEGNYEPVYTASVSYPITDTYSETMTLTSSASSHIGNLNITNVYQTTYISGVKEWEGGTPPESVTLELYQDDTKIAETEATADNDWKYSFGKYPVKAKDGHTYSYRIGELPVEGFVPEYSEYNAAKVHVGSYTSMNGKVAVSFRYKGDWYLETVTSNGSTNDDPTVIVPSTEFYILTPGSQAVPTVEPAILDGQNKRAVEQARASGKGTYDIHTDKEDLTVNYSKASTGSDYGMDAIAALQLREVGLDLIADGGALVVDGSTLKSGTVASNITLTQEYIDLMKLQMGVDETADDWNEEEFLEMLRSDLERLPCGIRYNSYPGKIKNISLDAKTSVSGKKDWQNDDASKRPASVVMGLYQNGEKIATQTVSEETKWRYEFKDLPRFDASGNEYSYTVTEEVVKGYKDSSSNHDGLRVQLSSDIEDALDNVQLSVRKDGIWYDYDPGSAGMTNEIIVPGEEVAVAFDSEISDEEVQSLYDQGIDNLISVDRIDEVDFPYDLTETTGEITWRDRNDKTRALVGGSDSYVPPSQSSSETVNATYIYSSNTNGNGDVIYYIEDGSVYRVNGTNGAVPSDEIYIENYFYTDYSYESASNYNDPHITARRGHADSFLPAEYVCSESEFRSQTQSSALGGTYPLVWSDSANKPLKDAFREYVNRNGYNWDYYSYSSYAIRSHVIASGSTSSVYCQDISETASGSIKTSDALKTKALALKFGNGNSSKVRETVHDDLLDEDVPVHAGHVNIIYEGADGNAHLWYGDFTDWADMLDGKTYYIPSGKFWITFYDEFGDPLDDADPILDVASVEEVEVQKSECIDALDMGMSAEDFFEAAGFDGEVRELTAGEPMHPKDGAEIKNSSVAFSASTGEPISLTSSADEETQFLIFDALDEYGEYRAFLGDDMVIHGDLSYGQDASTADLLVNGNTVGMFTAEYVVDDNVTSHYEIHIEFDDAYADKTFDIAKVDENNNRIESYKYSAAYGVNRELTPSAASMSSEAMGYQRTVLRYKSLSNTNSITNTYIEGEFKLQKKGILNNLLPGTEFSLFFADRDWTQLEDEPTAVEVVGEDGRLTFTGVPYGHYLLYETGTVDGYKSVTEPWRVLITETGAAEVEGGDGKLEPIEGTTKVYDNTNGMEIKFSDDTDITEAMFYCVIDGLVYEYIYTPEASLAGKTISLPCKEVYISTTYSMSSGSQQDGSAYGFKAASVKPKKVKFNGSDMHFLGNREEVLDYLEMMQAYDLVSMHECGNNFESLHYMPSSVVSDVYHYKYSYTEDGDYIERPSFVDRPGLKLKFSEQTGNTENIVIAYVYKDMLYAATWVDEDSGLRNEIFTRDQLSNAEFYIPAEKVYILGLEGDTAAVESIEDIDMQAASVEANIAVSVPLGVYDEKAPYNLMNTQYSLNDDDIVYMTACRKLSSFTDYPEEPMMPLTKRLGNGTADLSFGMAADMYTYAKSQAADASSSSVSIPSTGYKIEFGNENVLAENTQVYIISTDSENHGYIGSVYDEDAGEDTYRIYSASQLNGKTVYMPGENIFIYYFGSGDSDLDINSITATEISSGEMQKLKSIQQKATTEMGPIDLVQAELSMYTQTSVNLTGGDELLHTGDSLDDDSQRATIKYVYANVEPLTHGLKVTFGNDGSVDENANVSLFYGRDGGIYVHSNAYMTSYENLAGKTFYLPATEAGLLFQAQNNQWDKDTTAMHVMSIEEIDFTEEQGYEAARCKITEWGPSFATAEYIMIAAELSELQTETLTGSEQMLYPGNQLPESYWDSSSGSNGMVFYEYKLKTFEEIIPDNGITLTFGENSHIEDNCCFRVLAKINGEITDIDLRIDSYMLETILENGGKFSIPGAEEVYFVYDNGTGETSSTDVNEGDNVLDIVSIAKGKPEINMLTKEVYMEMAEEMMYGGSQSQYIQQELLSIASLYGETALTGRAQQLDIAVDGNNANDPYHIWGTDKIKKSFLPSFIESLLHPDRPVYEITNEQTVTEVSLVNEEDELIGGGTLQIIDDKGTVIDEWQTVEGEIHTTYGLIEGKTYTVHQTIVPDLYTKSDDVTFTVNTAAKTEVEVVNTKAKGITITTTSTGDGVDPSYNFSYTINVTGAKASTSYTITLSDNQTATLTTDATGKGTATITLQDGQSAKIVGVPSSTNVTVTQASCPYYASYEVTSSNNASNNETDKAITASVTMGTNDITIDFTNSKTMPIPTGVNKNHGLILLIIASIAILMVAFMKKKKQA